MKCKVVYYGVKSVSWKFTETDIFNMVRDYLIDTSDHIDGRSVNRLKIEWYDEGEGDPTLFVEARIDFREKHEKA